MRPVQISPSPIAVAADESDTPALSPVRLIKSDKYTQSRRSSGFTNNSIANNHLAIEKMTFDSAKDRNNSREFRNFGEFPLNDMSITFV